MTDSTDPGAVTHGEARAIISQWAGVRTAAKLSRYIDQQESALTAMTTRAEAAEAERDEARFLLEEATRREAELLDVCWEATGVADTVRGLTTLDDVIRVGRTKQREAETELAHLREAVRGYLESLRGITIESAEAGPVAYAHERLMQVMRAQAKPSLPSTRLYGGKAMAVEGEPCGVRLTEMRRRMREKGHDGNHLDSDDTAWKWSMAAGCYVRPEADPPPEPAPAATPAQWARLFDEVLEYLDDRACSNDGAHPAERQKVLRSAYKKIEAMRAALPAPQPAAAPEVLPVEHPYDTWKPTGPHVLDEPRNTGSPFALASDAWCDHTGKYREAELSKSNVIGLLIRAVWQLARKVDRLERGGEGKGGAGDDQSTR